MNLKESAHVRHLLTKNGFYKFSIEAVSPNRVESVKIKVEVLKFSPTTLRAAKTTEENIIQTTTNSLTEEEIFDENRVEAELKTEVDVEKAKNSEDTIKNITMKEETTTIAEEIKSNTSTNTLNLDENTMAVEGSSTTEEIESTTTIETTQTTMNTITSTTIPTVVEIDGSGREEIESSGRKEEENEKEMEGSGDKIDKKTIIKTQEEKSLQVELNDDSLTTTKEEETTVGENPDDEDNPLTDVTTITNSVEETIDDKVAPFDILFDGSKNKRITIESELHPGEVIHNMTIFILPTTQIHSKNLVSLEIDRSDIYEIRPRIVSIGGKAYLFIRRSFNLQGEIPVKVTATMGERRVKKTLIVVNSFEKTGEKIQSNEKEIQVKEIKVEVKEDSPPGTIITQIPIGYQLLPSDKLSDIFAINGKDLILSCGMDCLDYEKRVDHHIMLISSDKSSVLRVRIHVLDVNDIPPSLRLSSSTIRIAGNTLITPFAIHVSDGDSVGENKVRLEGEPSEFLGLQEVHPGLYQVIVTGRAASGKYQISISVTDGKTIDSSDVQVVVQNSSSKAHFRKRKYERKIKADRIKDGNWIAQFELEGIPIEDAKIVILDGNPGWLTVEEYGGRASVARHNGVISSGIYNIRIGAVESETGYILTETLFILNVIGGKKQMKTTFAKNIFENTLHRESAIEYYVPIQLINVEIPVQIDEKSIFAIDENGQKKELSRDSMSVLNDRVIFDKEELKDIRVVQIDLFSGVQRCSVVLHLISTEEFILDREMKENIPIFIDNINDKKLEVKEELPIGWIVDVLPAIHKKDKKIANLQIEGDDLNTFNIDQQTGVISIIRRLDYDSPNEKKHYQLLIIAGEKGYQTSLKLSIDLKDIDDNAPVIDMQETVKILTINEKTKNGEVLFSTGVQDTDENNEMEKYDITIHGLFKENYKAYIENETLFVKVSGEAQLDREKGDQQALTVQINDMAGNKNTIKMIVIISDVNEHKPLFSHDEYTVQAVEGWQKGIRLDRIHAIDKDSHTNIQYSITSNNSEHFIINESSGELSVSMALISMIRDEPYNITVTATDQGIPPLSSNITVRIKVREALIDLSNNSIIFINPSSSLILKEDTPLNQVIYNIKAENSKDAQRSMRYSVQELSLGKSHFEIDESSGILMLTERLDYEKDKHHTIRITAADILSPQYNSSHIISISVIDVDDNPPIFLQSSDLILTISSSSSTSDSLIMGRLTAHDIDSHPFNNIFYYLLPTCSSESIHFSLDQEFGEISYNPSNIPISKKSFQLCAIASLYRNIDVSNIEFDPSNISMSRFHIRTHDHQHHSNPIVMILNNTIDIIDDNLLKTKIILDEPSESEEWNYSLANYSFIPMSEESESSSSTINPFVVSPKTGNVRISPWLSNGLQGIYTLIINIKSALHKDYQGNIIKQYNFVKNENKLMLRLARSAREIGMKLEEMRSDLDEVFSDEKTKKISRFYLDEPKKSQSNSSKTTVCFHYAANNVILSKKNVMNYMGKAEIINRLTPLYHKYSIVNIESCSFEFSSVESSGLHLPIDMMLLISIILFLLTIIFLVCIYVTCIRRYKRHLKEKEMKMKASSQCNSHHSSPTFLPSHLLWRREM